MFSLLYSGMHSGQILMSDGVVTNLSSNGIGIRGNRLVKPGMELALFVDLPGVEEPLCIAQSRVYVGRRTSIRGGVGPLEAGGAKSSAILLMGSRHPLRPQRRHLRLKQEQGGALMKRAQVSSGNGLQSVEKAVDRRHDHRTSIEFGLMYSAQDRSGEILMGDGMVTDLSPTGLRHSRQYPGLAGDGTHDVPLPPRRKRPSVRDGNEGGLDFRTSIRSRDPQDELTGTKPAPLLLVLEPRPFRLD